MEYSTQELEQRFLDKRSCNTKEVKDCFKRNSINLKNAGFLNSSDKGCRNVSFLKDAVTKNFFVAPYDGSSSLITYSNGRKSCKGEEVFNVWKTLFISCLDQKFIVKRVNGAFYIYEKSPTLNNLEKGEESYKNSSSDSVFKIIKTCNSDIFNWNGLLVSYVPKTGQYKYRISIVNTEISIGPEQDKDEFLEIYACRVLILYLVYRSYVRTMDCFLEQLSVTEDKKKLQELFKEIITFKVSKLYLNPLKVHRGNEIPYIWEYIASEYRFKETVDEISGKIEDCSIFNQNDKSNYLSVIANRITYIGIGATVIIGIIQIIMG